MAVNGDCEKLKKSRRTSGITAAVTPSRFVRSGDRNQKGIKALLIGTLPSVARINTALLVRSSFVFQISVERVLDLLDRGSLAQIADDDERHRLKFSEVYRPVDEAGSVCLVCCRQRHEI
jgi:hypothetical protein